MHAVRIGLAFCTPIPFVRAANGQYVPERITIDWHRRRMAISLPTNFNVIDLHCDGMEVGDARNAAVLRALEHPRKPEFIFFLDYDVLPEFDAVTKLIFRARHFPDYDIFAGVYVAKYMNPGEPLIYKGDGQGPFWDYAMGDLITEGVTGVHMGCTLIRMSAFEKVPATLEEPWFKTVNEKRIEDGVLHSVRGTEDLYFCNKAVQAGCKILVDTSVMCGHIDHATGQIYGLTRDSNPIRRAHWLPGTGEPGSQQASDGEHEKLALDLGAGDMRREWPGYRVYTTDLRANVGADYVQDTRCLNLPDNHFDLVASSHHLEHIPRWEQEQAWAEIFRVTKRGGQIEHVVPDLTWAAAKIHDGHVDEHVMNVLYGAQEAHGYERTLNLHYFGYTPELAKELAERAGFVDVETRNWRQDETLGYNLIITGRKPAAAEISTEDLSCPTPAQPECPSDPSTACPSKRRSCSKRSKKRPAGKKP